MKGLEAVREKMIADYAEAIRDPRWYSIPAAAKKMQDAYERSLQFIEYGDYIIIKHGVHKAGYVVNTHQDKDFEFGDLLMVDTDNKPLRTVARGNVIRGELNRVNRYGV